MENFEECKKNLEVLIKEFEAIDKANINEANTRFKYIDKILIDCLGWQTDDISCEDNFLNKYSDYTLKLFRPVAILEAKKTGIYFELPVGSSKLIQPIQNLYKDEKDIKDAIDQVKGYCQDRSVQVAIVSNGWQIIAFIATRTDSIPALKGDALVISSLNEFRDNFKEVWNCLSRAGFEEEYLIKKLTGNKEQKLPPKLSSTIYKYPGIKNRNPFQNELEIISDLVLEDVIKEKDLEKDFLEFCYCKSGALSNYTLVSKAILTSRYSYIFEEGDRKATLEQVATRKGISKELIDQFANSLSKRPILLVGDVGVGKSTFIDYLRKVEAANAFEKAISFKIDLGSRAIISRDIRLAIISVIKEQLFDIYGIDIEDDDFVRQTYFLELKRFKKSVKVKRLYDIDPEKAVENEIDFLSAKVDKEIEHLKKSLEYICKHQKKQIITFIDNCDQRSDEDQETAFLVSQEFSTDWPMIVFISLRPETLQRTKRESGALSGYHTKAFTIPPPRLDEVIYKRLEFAQKITGGEIALSKLSTKTSFSQLHHLIEVFKYSLENNDSLLTFLNNISNENIRKAIELVKKFFGSGHVDMEKILEIYHNKGSYLIPIHELLRSVIYSDNIHYSPSNSEIINVFDVRNYKSNEHFLLLIFLSILDEYSKNSRNDGFISIEDLYISMQGIGYATKQIDSVLNFAYSKRLFETSQKGDLINQNNSELNIRITNLAVYHLRFLINSFTYVDAMIVDTPIFDDQFRKLIKNAISINDRLERCEIFAKYLDTQWDKSSLSTSLFDWGMISAQLREDIDRIKVRIEN
jgi:hypothetical protein